MRSIGFVVLLATLAAPALAELPPLSPDELDANATHVIAGIVTQVFTARKVHEDRKGWEDDVVCLEIRVVDVEKGEGIAVGQLVYARTWDAAERPDGWAGPGGQYEVPAVGALVRVHLEQGEDGGRDILIPNGINAAGSYEGVLRHKPWTKSAESFEAGGSDYFVLEVEGGEKHFVRPTSAVDEARLKELDGKAVAIRGSIVPGVEVEIDPNSPHPVGESTVRRGKGLRAYEVTAR